MNILFLTVADIRDVNERTIYNDLLRKFKAEGHSVYVISPVERKHRQGTSCKEESGIIMLRVRTLNIQKTNIFEKGLSTVMLEWQFLAAYKKYFSTISFDLVLYATPPITLTRIVSYIKKNGHARSYLLLKDIFPQNAVDLGMMSTGGFLYRTFRKKEKQLYKLSDRIGCMSPANIAYLLKHNPEIEPKRVEVNPNSIEPIDTPLDSNQRNEIRRKFGIPEDAVVFIYGGNLGKPQGIGFLLEALSENLDKGGTFFVVIGSGTEFPTVEAWYKEKAPQNVLVMKGLPKDDYDRLVAACDIGLIFLDRRFTIPNFPSRLLSYLERKMPVLAATDTSTDIGRILEDSGSGFWVESGDIRSFNERIDYFMAHREAIGIMGEKGYQLLMANYTVSQSYDIIMKEGRDV